MKNKLNELMMRSFVLKFIFYAIMGLKRRFFANLKIAVRVPADTLDVVGFATIRNDPYRTVGIGETVCFDDFDRRCVFCFSDLLNIQNL